MIKHRFSCLAAVLLLGLHANPAAAQIKIAVAGPFTGSNAAFGEQLFYGAKQAVEDLNARKGVLGQKLEIVAVDDASDRRRALRRRPTALRTGASVPSSGTSIRA